MLGTVPDTTLRFDDPVQFTLVGLLNDRPVRVVEPDTPQKLHGQLRLLVNDEWAITDAGLESRLSNYCSESLGEGREGENRPDGHDANLWDEAVFYAHLLLTP